MAAGRTPARASSRSWSPWRRRSVSRRRAGCRPGCAACCCAAWRWRRTIASRAWRRCSPRCVPIRRGDAAAGCPARRSRSSSAARRRWRRPDGAPRPLRAAARRRRSRPSGTARRAPRCTASSSPAAAATPWPPSTASPAASTTTLHGDASAFSGAALQCEGDALLGLGKPAVDLLERALRQIDDGESELGELAAIRFSLARALAAAHRDPARAHDLALQARDELRAGGTATQLDLARVESWLKQRP
jgi:hypothetical protein